MCSPWLEVEAVSRTSAFHSECLYQNNAPVHLLIKTPAAGLFISQKLD
jgi:hypothetical protein